MSVLSEGIRYLEVKADHEAMGTVEVGRTSTAAQIRGVADRGGEVAHAGGRVIERLAERVGAENGSTVRETSLHRQLAGVIVGVCARLGLRNRGESVIGPHICTACQAGVIDIRYAEQLHAASANIRAGQD